MAIGPLDKPWSYPSASVGDAYDVEFNVTDIPIGGKLLQASLELNPMDEMQFKTSLDYKLAMKHKIAAEIGRAMINSGLIEFTHLPHNGGGRDTIYARCYLAPDSQVKVLRTHYGTKK